MRKSKVIGCGAEFITWSTKKKIWQKHYCEHNKGLCYNCERLNRGFDYHGGKGKTK